jgi:hypothetical protein
VRKRGILVAVIENSVESEKRAEQEFLELAGRFRSATDPEEVGLLGDRMGRKVFCDCAATRLPAACSEDR